MGDQSSGKSSLESSPFLVASGSAVYLSQSSLVRMQKEQRSCQDLPGGLLIPQGTTGLPADLVLGQRMSKAVLPTALQVICVANTAQLFAQHSISERSQPSSQLIFLFLAFLLPFSSPTIIILIFLFATRTRALTLTLTAWIIILFFFVLFILSLGGSSF